MPEEQAMKKEPERQTAGRAFERMQPGGENKSGNYRNVREDKL